MEEIVALLSKETGNAITYVDESVEEAYESRKNGQHKTGSTMLGSVPIQRLKLGNKPSFNRCQKGIRTSSYEFNRCFERKTVA